MVGNDVVDLADRETAPLAMHPRFDERVFAAEELLWMRREGDPARRRWMLWAAKESAFKAAKRLDPSSSFSPRRVLVRLGDDSTGTVRLADRTFSVQVRLDRDVCHAVAWADRAHLSHLAHLARSPIVVSGVRLVMASEASPRLAARRFAAESVAAYLGIAASDLELVKDGRLPRLRLHGRAAGLDVSLSHHGRFVAFACALARQ
jgi:phosphopantetheinyl transferase (holo-ACP synthase)